MDGGACSAAVHGVEKSQTRLSDFTFTFHFHALEKEMATHSNILGWKVLWMEEGGRLQCMELQRIIPGILQARTPEWVPISFSNAWK